MFIRMPGPARSEPARRARPARGGIAAGVRRAIVPEADVALGVECAFPFAESVLGHRDRRRIRWRRLARIAVVLGGAGLLAAGLWQLGPGARVHAGAGGPEAQVHAAGVIPPRPNPTDGRPGAGEGVAFLLRAPCDGLARSGVRNQRRRS